MSQKIFNQELLDRFLAYLKSKGELVRVSRDRLSYLASQHGYASNDIYYTLKRLEEIANIGSEWNREKKTLEFMWTEWQEGDELRQQAIDEF